MDLPDTIAIHSPGAVEYAVFIVIPAMGGDQARFVISLGAVYAITGSVMTRFFTSGRGELSRALAGRGEPGSVCGDKSHKRSWQSSPVRGCRARLIGRHQETVEAHTCTGE
jgi:hypothetical protein